MTIMDNEFAGLFVVYPFLRGMAYRSQLALQRNAWSVRLSAGRTLYDIGSHCRAFLLITSGSIRVFSYRESRQVRLLTLEPGKADLFSIACLLGNMDHQACAVVDQDLTGIGIPKDLFLDLVQNSVRFRNFIYQEIGNGIDRLQAMIHEISFLSIDQRLAVLLLSRSPRIIITHQQLADELGSVREVISRALKGFETQGVIQRTRGRIIILDPDTLCKIAKPYVD